MYGPANTILSTTPLPKADTLARVYSGPSTVLGFYDSNSRGLHVAFTGDSCAVLGRRTQKKNGDVVYQVHVLTVEQDGGNLAEEYRLNAGQPVPSHIKSPPDLTAKPEVTVTSVQPGDFLIMGTRGMWERLTSEEAVGLIGTWLDEQWRQHSERTKTKPVVSMNDFLGSPPVVEALPNRTEDPNAATHLLKNALGKHSRGEGSVALYSPVIWADWLPLQEL